MARHRRARHYGRYRQPSLWNTLRFRMSLHPLFNPLSRFPHVFTSQHLHTYRCRALR